MARPLLRQSVASWQDATQTYSDRVRTILGDVQHLRITLEEGEARVMSVLDEAVGEVIEETLESE